MSYVMRLIFGILFAVIAGACVAVINLPFISKMLIACFFGALAGILGIVLTNWLERSVKTKNALRVEMYKRLQGTTLRARRSHAFTRYLQETSDRVETQFLTTMIYRMANEGYSSVIVQFSIDGTDFIDAPIPAEAPPHRYARYSIDGGDRFQSVQLFQGEHPTQSEGVLPPPADISEPVASGEIKSTGQSVSVEDVITRIDKELEENGT